MANATFGQYNPYESELDPRYRQLLGQLMSGQLTPAQQQALEQQRERGLGEIRSAFMARGAPTGARRSAEQGFLRDIAMQSALQAGQQQMAGLQYGLPYERFRAEQYWRPQEMELRRWMAEQQYREEPWYTQMLGGIGQAIPYAAKAIF